MPHLLFNTDDQVIADSFRNTSQVILNPDIPPKRPFNPIVGSMLVHEMTELAGHAGEISYIRGLQRGMDK